MSHERWCVINISADVILRIGFADYVSWAVVIVFFDVLQSRLQDCEP